MAPTRPIPRLAPRPPAPRVSITPGEILLSLLVPTVPGREAKLASLLERLDRQIRDRKDVQLIVLRDNRSMPIGEKRNKMLSLASGAYVAFIDDDDMVTEDYVESIIGGLATGPDVLTFLVKVTGHGAGKICRYGLALQHQDLPTEYRRQPNHLMAWKRTLALAVRFPAVHRGEDTEWAKAIARHAATEEAIHRVLYTYQFDPADNSMMPR